MNRDPNRQAADDAALVHSRELEQLICREIERHGGQITFARFMELALYSPGLGYYSAGMHKLGPRGDFVTAPEISPLFSRCVARQCREILAALPGCDMLEVGAGSGAMAVELLAELQRLGSPPRSYRILESSADLRERQEALIQARIPSLAHHVQWLDRLPREFEGIVLANELLDALPVHRFVSTEQGLREQYVAREGDRFVYRDGPLSDERIARRVTEIEEWLETPLPKPYRSEINFAAEAWCRSLADAVARGVVLIFDYGYPRREYYHPQRADGTLMCYHRHHATSDPLVRVGLQDITSHVEFTGIATAATEAGFEVSGFTTQAYFLMGCGLAELMHFDDNDDVKKRIRLAQQARILTMPGEMGELVKVLGLQRGLEIPLRGFSVHDQRFRL